MTRFIFGLAAIAVSMLQDASGQDDAPSANVNGKLVNVQVMGAAGDGVADDTGCLVVEVARLPATPAIYRNSGEFH